eukprot:scaffold164224_cov66-Cyclotella_meneghiniana.AAC.1
MMRWTSLVAVESLAAAVLCLFVTASAFSSTTTATNQNNHYVIQPIIPQNQENEEASAFEISIRSKGNTHPLKIRLGYG